MRRTITHIYPVPIFGIVSENGTPEKVRIRSLDLYKGIAILGIIAVHVIIFPSMQQGETEGSGLPLVVQGLYLGLLGFFAISGYFYRPNRGFANNVKKRLSILGLGYLACSLILPLILCLEMAICGPNSPSIEDYGNALKWIYCSPTLWLVYDAQNYYASCAVAIGYYYIQIMLVAFLVFYLVADRIICSWKRLLVTCIVLVTIQTLLVQYFPYNLPFHCHELPIAVMFMLLGAFAGQYRLVERAEFNGGWRDKYVLLGIGICVLITAVLTYLFPPGTGFNDASFGNNGGWSVPPFAVNAAAMIMVEVYICILLSKIPLISTFIMYLGRHTLSLMLLNGFVIKMLIIPFYEIPHNTWFPPLEFGVQMTIYAMCVIVPIVISNIVVKHLAPFFFKYVGKDTGSPL